MIQRALVADDESMDRNVMQETLLAVDETIDVETASNGEEACRLLEQNCFDVVFTDLKMPQKDGLQVLETARSAPLPSEVVIITGYGDVHTAVAAMKKGSFDYLLKPICLDQVEALVNEINEHRRFIADDRRPDFELALPDGRAEIIGESNAIKEVCDKAVHVGATDATVLLQGASGTGKELVSTLIHRSSPRRAGPLIRVNCASLSETILESELFGHEKGAFTGAHATKPGRFELANGGTLLLDEISETSRKLQAELLRVIEQKVFERVGGTATLRVDVRIIATTNRDLATEVAEGRFREDLFYRLNVVPLTLPPLRNRDGDVEVLSNYFARKFARQFGKSCPTINEAAMARLRQHRWPGNVRELENTIQRLVIMDRKGAIEAADVPAYVGDRNGPLSKELASVGTLENMEREAILSTLRQVNGSRTRAAEKLRISTRTIRNKLNKYKREGHCKEIFS